jgi:hypothetical protein
VKKLAIPLAAVAAALLPFAASDPADAGGWAVTTLDPLAPPVAGEQVDVGFTIRQHGVRPVAVDDVSIVVTDTGGAQESFPARPDGPVGHYIATVTFPADGPVRWRVEQGWFGPQDLGVVSPTSAAPEPAAPTQPWPALWRIGLPVLAAAFVLALVLGRRRRTPHHATA